jgi:hypothetical protein
MKVYLLFLEFFCCWCSVDAFGYLAHQIIADLTWINLNKDAKSCISKMFLKDNLSFSKMAHWPDKMKRMPKFAWSKKYHYLNIDDDPPNTCASLKDLKVGRNLLSAIIYNYSRLKRGSRNWRHLSFLIHLFSDLHQPLHRKTKC